MVGGKQVKRGVAERRASVLGAVVWAAAVLALGASPAAGLAGKSGAPTAGRAADPSAGDLTVRGSLKQIHVIHADPGVQVAVRGPRKFSRTAVTDDRGGLVLRGIPAGRGYTVRIEGNGRSRHPVRVLGMDDVPRARFYESQELEPTRGYIETRDGTLLSYRVVLPDPEAFGPGPYDVIVNYSGYTPGLRTDVAWKNQPFEQFSAAGYAVVGVNMRGSGCSGGAMDFMEKLTWLDGYDAVEALARQPWVDDVALGAQSYPGLTQNFVASTQPPSLDAIVPGSVVGDFYRDVFYPGGIQNVGFGNIWAGGQDAERAFPSSLAVVNEAAADDPVCMANQGLRGQNLSLVEAIADHPFDDKYWRDRSAEPRVGKITVPTLQTVSWQDPQVGGRPAHLFGKFSDATPVRLLGTNGFHTYYEGDTWVEILRFLDVYLGESSAARVAEYEAEDPVMVLLERNPAGEARARFALPSLQAAGDGRRLTLGDDLLADDPDQGGKASSFTYDPSAHAGLGDIAWERLQDQLTFTSPPLEEDTVMAGSGSADLWAAAEATDVDLQVTLTEVRPDGQEMLVQSGWLRATHRALDEPASTALRPRQLHTARAARDLVPGELTPMRIEIFPFAHAFRKGSRLRLTISGPGGGSNGWPWDFEALPGGFDVTIAHDADHPSSVVLPVVEVPGLDLPAEPPVCGTIVNQPCRPAE